MSQLNYVSKVHATLSYSNTFANISLIPENIRELLDRMAAKHPSKVAYIFPHNGPDGLELTYLDLQCKVRQVAQSLLKLGLVKGDTIAFSLPNTHELLVLFFAAASIGLVSLFIEPLNQLMEFEYYLKKTKAKALVYCDLCEFGTRTQYEIMEELCPELKTTQFEDKIIDSANLPDLKRLIYLQASDQAKRLG